MANDDELDKQIRDGLKGDIPPPDPAAKRRAIAMARAEFEAEHAQLTENKKEKEIQKRPQGLLGWLRLIIGSKPEKEGAMIPFNQKLIYSGVAAAAVAAVAVGISLQTQRTDFGTGIPELNIPTEMDEIAVTGTRRSDDAAQAQPDGQLAREERKRENEIQAVAPREPASAEQFADKDAAGRASSIAQAPAEVMAESLAGALEPAALRQAAPSKAKVQMAPGVVADSDVMPVPGYQDVGRDDFEAFEQNTVKLVSEEPVSTFSVDVDTASYSFVRRMLNQGVLPQSDAVRAEELINYFDYSYSLPESKSQPFEPSVAVVDSPWAEGRQLMRIGIKGYDIAASEKPRTNLVFLLDVSGSMNSPDKLPLVKQSMEMLLSTLDPDDTVAIAVYAGAAGTVLEPTPVKEKQKILDAMRQLSAGGSTAGAQGIRLAYELAESQFDKDAINRVILATDGDFNVGITNQRELQSFIERKRDKGIFLSVLGFGQGNYHDSLMQTLAQNGNGVAAYIDTLSEAQKVLVDEASSTLFPIARDVKIQVEFNPATVAEYRLIGYETRHLNREDFNNDAVDAGDIGAGHTVTAIYEFTPVGSDARQIEDSRYAPTMEKLESNGEEYAFLKIRYKLPEEDTSKLITRPITRQDVTELSGDTGFATAVAGFAQILKGGKYTGDFDYDDVIELAQKTKGQDPYGYRSEFVQLARKAKTAAAMQAR
jgi:Ca-activated chloride channel family protein